MEPENKNRIFIIIAVLLSVVIIMAAAYFYLLLYKESLELKNSLDIAKENISRAQKDNADLQEANDNLSESLAASQAQNAVFESQIREISGTVGTLQKLSQTDPELLKKYSKVYFLSENYIPAKLVQIDSQYLWEKAKPQQIQGDTAPFLTNMLIMASSSGINLEIVSAYRSFYDQLLTKTSYKVLYGSGANQFSADQGYSEHQLGTTVDLTVPKLNGLSLQFENDDAYAWLRGNAYKFGFVLSYPKNNSYYQFEPWHWRFVGIALATKLHTENKNFYDLTQREIDEYLISLFDSQ
ncbi:MAG: M15 family metallopeptidase [Candidatus Paceibacterota bacterium]